MRRASFLILVLIGSIESPFHVDGAEQPYFQNKTITLQVGAPAGGRQDRIARTMAKYLTKYTPGSPAFLIQNKSGGQGIPAMLTLSKGPTDGSFMSKRRTSARRARPMSRATSSTSAGRAPASSATFFSCINERESKPWMI
jgi:tripartite-type tricarboxylate transporter receptor subunit TctC